MSEIRPLAVILAGLIGGCECDWTSACSELEGESRDGARVCGHIDMLELVGRVGFFRFSDAENGPIIERCLCDETAGMLHGCEHWEKDDCARAPTPDSCDESSIDCVWTGSACAWKHDLPLVECSYEFADCLEGLCSGCTAGSYGSCPPEDSRYEPFCTRVSSAECSELAANPEVDQSPGTDGRRTFYRSVRQTEGCP
jgi:hypothetical protein